MPQQQKKPDIRRGEIAFIFAIVMGLVLGILIRKVRIGILIGLVLSLIILFAGRTATTRK